MKGYQPIVGSRQLKKIYIPKPLSILQKKRLKSTSILSAATLLHRCHSILLNGNYCYEFLDLRQALSSMGQTISFSLTLGLTFCLNLGTNLVHMNPFLMIFLVTHKYEQCEKGYTLASIESKKTKETTIGRVHNDAPDISVESKDELHA